MRKIHGASMHRGKVPVGQDKKETEVTISVKEEERRKSEMEKALGAEDYERAAEIRDKLKTLRKTLEAKGKV
jgi:protein arginine kinase activator